MFYSQMDSPIGTLLLAANDEGLKRIGFPRGKGHCPIQPEWVRNDKYFNDTRKQLQAYFKGQLKQFEVRLSPDGTAFQLAVLNVLQTIPYGETRSYIDVARKIGRPKASRAVGAANGHNPIPIIIPCHRVIGSNGKLTGFGGGLDTKAFLLELEGIGQPGLKFSG